MDVVGSEIGQKMRSAIKAKLTELGCYVDDELPDYVMVMVANKRTRVQMEDDLQLFLGDNTELFVNWLHQVLKKLQEVTVPPMKTETNKVKSKKEKKSKEKKDKTKDKDKTKTKKTEGLKKAKKKDKEKSHRKKEDKKSHKRKKKTKHHEMIHPNVPPLLMNIEKESEPSITDVFAGQILKSHGITIESPKAEKKDEKPAINEMEVKRPIVPIIDPATIPSQSEPEVTSKIEEPTDKEHPEETIGAPREEQLKEINEIEAKIIGLRQKLAEQLDSMSDDEDFLNIRTEAEELMNDFAEDVYQEITSQTPAVATPPVETIKVPSPSPPEPTEPPPQEVPKDIPKEPEELPQIELNLPKRPIRDRLGAREEKKAPENKAPEKKSPEKATEEQGKAQSPERLTPEKEPDFWGKHKPAKSRLGSLPEPKRSSFSDESTEDSDDSSKRVTSSMGRSKGRVSCASVVRVRPRPRVTANNSLLLRAVADAHKSLLNIPPKVEPNPPAVKRALVLPMRRTVDAHNIVIRVPRDGDTADDKPKDKPVYASAPILRRTDRDRTASRREDSLILETINIHNKTIDKDKQPQFIVTMDGFNPNAFLAKKLLTEGIINDENEIKNKPITKSVLKTAHNTEKDKDIEKDGGNRSEDTNLDHDSKADLDVDNAFKNKHADFNEAPKVQHTSDYFEHKDNKEKSKRLSLNTPKDTIEKTTNEDATQTKLSPKTKGDNTNETISRSKEKKLQKKRLSDTSTDSDTKVIIKTEKNETEKRSSEEIGEEPTPKKRKASPIVFDVKKEKEEVVRKRNDSTSSDNHVIVTTNTGSHKYDSLPPLSAALPPSPPVPPPPRARCRSFPLCPFGASCAFAHPRCKFAAGCTRRGCPYDHPDLRNSAAPVVASHVVPAANFKSITPSALPSVCKFYPNCVNPTCRYFHPKPCRYGTACSNKAECNFYHGDVAAKWRYPV